MRARGTFLPRIVALMLAMAMGGTATACGGPAQEEVAQETAENVTGETPEASDEAADEAAVSVAPEAPIDSAGGGRGAGAGGTGSTGGAAGSRAAGSVARLNIILASETWRGIDEQAAREAALVRAIESLVARVGGDSITVIEIEVSPAIGALRLTLPDSLVALSLASRLRTLPEVTSADLDRRDVRRHP